ncbi:hypothetical protein DLM75_19660 [Leptospira stimsonii]|uniref:Uncharacterized protein n=1 Tax=Leptospira stimsonii TaxID=2202203 RepID=A0A396YWG9_9LEPT|nr:hypothetical protein DLM75_19660 [Leptospira stimsonii]
MELFFWSPDVILSQLVRDERGDNIRANFLFAKACFALAEENSPFRKIQVTSQIGDEIFSEGNKH